MNKSYYFTKYFLLLILVILVQGCIGEKKQYNLNIPDSVPTWYINSPINTPIHLYGIGEGDSIKEAKANSLNDMSSRLLVRIESSLETKKSTSLDFYEKEVNQDIKVDIEQIQYTNVKIDKNSFLDYKYYILTKVNRNQQFEEKKKEFDILDKKLTKKYNSLKRKNTYEKIIILENMKESIAKNKKRAFILYAIKNEFNYGKYFEKYSDYIELIQTLKNQLKVSIRSDEYHNYFKDILTDEMNKDNYKISSNNPDIKISIKNKKRYSNSRGWIIVKISSTISIISKGKTVSNNIINTIGRSTSSKENAVQDASIEFSQLINDKGLNKLLFNKE